MNELIEYLLNYAFDHGISYILTRELSPSCSSACDVSKKKMVINLNWENKAEIPFVIGHEIGHIMNNDIHYTCQSSSADIKKEEEADLYALDLIYQYADQMGFDFTEPAQFMQQFGIPDRMIYKVNNLFLKEA